MEQKPNIILINCDDLGYGDLGCYGSKVHKTPAIDRLASEGLRFTDFYMASPVCTPSRGAMMTGCYPPRIGFGDFGGPWGVLFPGDPYGIHEDEHTLPQLLRDVGYRTKLVGKWHCGDQPGLLPTDRGFDEYYGLPYSNDMGRQPGRRDSAPLPLMRDEEVVQQQPDQRGLTERYTEECVRFLRDHRERPFFLYLAHMYVHVPLFVPERFMKQSDNGAYGGAVEHIDWTLQVLMQELKDLGLDDNTLVIFTSDNGSRARGEGGSNAPLRGLKRETWEGGLRVPCIIRWPGRIQPGGCTREIATAMEFLPTLVGLAGGEVPKDHILDGLDISELLLDDQAASPRKVFYYYIKNNLEAVREGPWKLHVRKGDTAIRELYNLETDPGESEDLLQREPGVVERLEALLEEARADLGDEATGRIGAGVRPKACVENPRPLTEYREDHPYMIASYDLADSKTLCG